MTTPDAYVTLPFPPPPLPAPFLPFPHLLPVPSSSSASAPPRVRPTPNQRLSANQIQTVYTATNGPKKATTSYSTAPSAWNIPKTVPPKEKFAGYAGGRRDFRAQVQAARKEPQREENLKSLSLFTPKPLVPATLNRYNDCKKLWVPCWEEELGKICIEA
ncbi:hypothetical protein NLJ89_g1249 [Agrocybe chaxingu]|uniref:Uncharacterized protein n=1 Tax=Agrocybe chaxingu TaxID=84603 RepID=A0A9W8TDQ8_9AGAR|nr:hypothetical protein NLJ89_g1249 [Agrocybe chaxingu]